LRIEHSWGSSSIVQEWDPTYYVVTANNLNPEETFNVFVFGVAFENFEHRSFEI